MSDYYDYEEMMRQKELERAMMVNQSSGAASSGPPPGAMQAASKMMGGGGGGGGMGAAGPWAALAAAIIANETGQRGQGRRPDSKSAHGRELLTGEVLATDAEALGDKVGGAGGKFIETAGKLGNPRDTLKVLEKTLKPWEWF